MNPTNNYQRGHLKIYLNKISRYPAPVRLAIFLFTLLLCWLPVATPIYLLGSDRNLVTILTMGLLYIIFIFLLRIWGKKVYQQPNILKIYGLEITKKNGLELLTGLGFGVTIALFLFICQGWLGWLGWQPPAMFFPRLVIEGLLSALAVGFAEELVFRGWLLNEMQRDYTRLRALWGNAIIFALLHFIKPIGEIIRTFPQFPGLVLLGLILVWAKRGSSDRLGLSIGFHGGLVWGYYIINVGKLVEYSGKVSDWITGVDKNPLAGAIGLLFLGAIAFFMRQRAIYSKS